MSTKRNILIIASNPKGQSTKRIEEEAVKRGHEVSVLAPDDFYLHTSNVNGHDKIYVKSERIFKKNVDCIIPRISGDMAFGAAVVNHWHDNIKVPTTSTGNALRNASDKWKTTQLLSKNRVRVPLTTIMKQPEDFATLIATVGGLPAVAKTLTGSQGKGVFILETALAGSTTLQAFSNSKTMLVLQQYIETAKEDDQKNDIRVWVINGQVVAAYKRLSLHKDFRSNYSLSKEGEKIEITKEEKQMALDAVEAVGLYCGGVDIMRDAKDGGKPYVIEVNGNPSLKGVEAVTGINVAAKLVDFAELLCIGQRQKAQYSPDNSAVRALNTADPRDKYLDSVTRRALGLKG